LKKFDKYIIKTYISTFLVALALIIAIVIVFDLSEKIDDFLGKHGKIPTLYEIIVHYYLNFVPYFAGLYAPLFVFISVIFFTSRMAARMELISVLVSGVSYGRMLRPFFISAAIISLLLLVLVNFVIPKANVQRLMFERQYFGQNYFEPRNIHRQVKPGLYMYIEYWSPTNNFGQKFSLERISGQKIISKLMAQNISYDSIADRWLLSDYMIRNMRNGKEWVRHGASLDTTFSFKPNFFTDFNQEIQTMTYPELNKFIEEELETGSASVNHYLIEKHKRAAIPLSTIILTLIAVPLAGRKARGGIGLHIGAGIALGFTYIFFDKISVTYAQSGLLPPLVAVWIPNILFGFIGIYLLRKAQK